MNIDTLSQAFWCDLLLFVLAHFLWQATLVVLLTGGLVKCLRKSRASVRYGIHACALFLTIACPIMTAAFFSSSKLMPAASETGNVDDIGVSSLIVVDVPEQENNVVTSGTYSVDAEPPLSDLSSAKTSPSNSRVTASPSTKPGDPEIDGIRSGSLPFRQVQRLGIVGLYLLGVMLMLVRLLFSLLSANSLRYSTLAIDDPELLNLFALQAKRLRLRAAPIVRLSQRVVVPTIVGILRPVILLPVTMITQLTPEQFGAVITHELAHIRRLDPLLNLLQRTAEVAFFFHPAVWLLSRWLTHERELACDEVVVSAGESAVNYAETLLRVAEIGMGKYARSPLHQMLVLHAVQNESALHARVRVLLGIPVAGRFRISHLGAAGFALLIATVVTAGSSWANWMQAVDVTSSPATGGNAKSWSKTSGNGGVQPGKDKAISWPPGSPLLPYVTERFPELRSVRSGISKEQLQTLLGASRKLVQRSDEHSVGGTRLEFRIRDTRFTASFMDGRLVNMIRKEPSKTPVVRQPSGDEKGPDSSPGTKSSSADQGADPDEKAPSARDSSLAPPADLTPREMVNGFLDRLLEGKKMINGIRGSWDHAWAYTTRENGWGVEMQRSAGRPAFRAAAHLESKNRALVLTAKNRASVSSSRSRIGVFDLIRRDGRWLIQNMEMYKPESAWLVANGFARNDDVSWGILRGDIVGAYHSGIFAFTEHRFDADGTYSLKAQSEPQVSGTWRLEGDVLIRSIDGKQHSNRITRFFDEGFVIEFGKRNRAGYYRMSEENNNKDPNADAANDESDKSIR